MSASPVVVRQRIAAAPERVFEAWLDPTTFAKWICPPPGVCASVEIDAREGGHFRIVMIFPDAINETTGRYLRINRPVRLEFTWSATFLGDIETTVVVELASAAEEGTDLTITHYRLPPAAIAAHEHGWAAITVALATVLTPDTDDRDERERPPLRDL